MARIDEFLAKILSSRYGKDVRGAIHDSIEEINNVNEANIDIVQGIADTAQGYANNASTSASTAQQAVTDAQTARTGAETAEDGAEHFYQETLAIAQSLGSALIPKGTVEFANLPSVSSTAVKDGFMWNISDPFTTTSDFVEGAGLSIPMGANVYKVTINNVPKWDILAGSSAQVFTGTEAQIAQAIQQGLLGEGVMINSLDDGDDELLTTSMIYHDHDSLENKLDDIDNSISKLNSDLTDMSGKVNDAYSTAALDIFISENNASLDVEIVPYAVYLMTLGASGGGGSRFLSAAYYIVAVDSNSSHTVVAAKIGGNSEMTFNGQFTWKNGNTYTITNPNSRRIQLWKLGLVTK